MKLLVIDPNISSQSPSIRFWTEAFDFVKDLFEKVEIWSLNCEIEESSTVAVREFKPFAPGLWGELAFRLQVANALKQRGRHPDELVQITGFGIQNVDIRYIQFSHLLLTREIRKRNLRDQFSLKKWLFSVWEGQNERRILNRRGSTKHWLVVSRNLGRKIQSLDTSEGKLSILPNQYDYKRFNHEVAASFRGAMRGHYGFSENDLVFAFSAFGHFERKGLLQCCETISLLRGEGHPAKLLVLGGKPETIEAFRSSLRGRGISEEGIVWAGLVDHIEQHLSAADAYFFPSHFEAFALAEIEAAALGLRLYLTKHYGSEMIMREGTNGRFLPWNSKGMAEVIAGDIRSGEVAKRHEELGEAPSPEEFRTALRDFYSNVISETN